MLPEVEQAGDVDGEAVSEVVDVEADVVVDGEDFAVEEAEVAVDTEVQRAVGAEVQRAVDAEVQRAVVVGGEVAGLAVVEGNYPILNLKKLLCFRPFLGS